MYKKGDRDLDMIFHGIPYYPFSNSPDGRIVGELNRGRRDQQEFNERNQSIQRRALSELEAIHRGLTVSRSDLREDSVRDIFGRVAQQMCENFGMMQAQTNGMLAGVGNVMHQGFSQVHGDLSDIRGPALPRMPLNSLIQTHDEWMEILAAYRKHILNTEGSVQLEVLLHSRFSQFTAKVDGMKSFVEDSIGWDNNAGKDELDTLNSGISSLRNPAFLLTTPKETRRQLLDLWRLASKYACSELIDYIRLVMTLLTEYEKAEGLEVSSEMIIKLANNDYLTSGMRNKAMQVYPEARNDGSITTMNYSLRDLTRDSRTATGQRNFQILQGAALYEQARTIAHHGEIGIRQREDMLEQGAVGISQRDAMIDQNQVGIGQRERIIQLEENSLANQEALIGQMGRLSMQSALGNYRLDQIIDHLAQENDELVNIQELLTNFMILFDREMHALASGIGERLDRLRAEQALTRMSIMTGLANIGEILDRHFGQVELTIARTNAYLQNILETLQTSHENEARQFFSDGKACMDTAETVTDLEDAYKAFHDGIEKVRTSAENHFGAGRAAEMMGKLELAKDHYRKAGQRAKPDQSLLSSEAYDSAANIAYLQKNFPEAVTFGERALNLDKDNSKKKYKYAKYLAANGEYSKAADLFFDAVSDDENLVLALISDPIYDQIPNAIKRALLKNLWAVKAIKNMKTALSIMDALLNLDDLNEASEICLYVLRFSPEMALEEKIWLHPKFGLLKARLADGLPDLLTDEAGRLISINYFQIVIFLFNCTIDQLMFDFFIAGLHLNKDFLTGDFDNTKKYVLRTFEICAGKQYINIWNKLKKFAKSEYLWIFN